MYNNWQKTYKTDNTTYVVLLRFLHFFRGSCGEPHGRDSRGKSLGRVRVWEDIKQ